MNYFRLSFIGRERERAGAFCASQYFDMTGTPVSASPEQRFSRRNFAIHTSGGNSNIDFRAKGDGTFGYLIQQEQDKENPCLSVAGVVFAQSRKEQRGTPPAGIKLVLPPRYAADPAALVEFVSTTAQAFIDTCVDNDGYLSLSLQECERVVQDALGAIAKVSKTLFKPDEKFWGRALYGNYQHFWVPQLQDRPTSEVKDGIKKIAFNLFDQYVQGGQPATVLLSAANVQVLSSTSRNVNVVDVTDQLSAPTAISAPTNPSPSLDKPLIPSDPSNQMVVGRADKLSPAEQELFGRVDAQRDMIGHLLQSIVETSRQPGAVGEHAQQTLIKLASAVKDFAHPSAR